MCRLQLRRHAGAFCRVAAGKCQDAEGGNSTRVPGCSYRYHARPLDCRPKPLARRTHRQRHLFRLARHLGVLQAQQPSSVGSCSSTGCCQWCTQRRRKSLHDERSWHGLNTSNPIYAVLTLSLRLRSTDHHEAAAAPDAGRASHLDAMPDAVVQRNDRCCSNVDACTFHQVQQALEFFEDVPFLFATTPAGRYVSECRRCQDAPAALAGYTAARVRHSAP